MKKYLKSWQVNAGALLAALGFVQANLQTLNLSPAVQGWALVLIGAAVIFLRVKTENSKPLKAR